MEKDVLFREVSSVQGCPYRGVPLLYTGVGREVDQEERTNFAKASSVLSRGKSSGSHTRPEER